MQNSTISITCNAFSECIAFICLHPSAGNCNIRNFGTHYLVTVAYGFSKPVKCIVKGYEGMTGFIDAELSESYMVYFNYDSRVLHCFHKDLVTVCRENLKP